MEEEDDLGIIEKNDDEKNTTIVPENVQKSVKIVKPSEIPVDKVKIAYYNSGCDATKTSEKLGISRQSFYNILKKNPEIKEVKEYVAEDLKSDIVSSLGNIVKYIKEESKKNPDSFNKEKIFEIGLKYHHIIADKPKKDLEGNVVKIDMKIEEEFKEEATKLKKLTISKKITVPNGIIADNIADILEKDDDDDELAEDYV